jgi:hypothetical protein
MTDEQLAAMHRLLAEYHRRLAKEAVLDVIQQYHSDLAQRLSDEAALIPRRTAIVERLHERERQKRTAANKPSSPPAGQRQKTRTQGNGPSAIGKAPEPPSWMAAFLPGSARTSRKPRSDVYPAGFQKRPPARDQWHHRRCY